MNILIISSYPSSNAVYKSAFVFQFVQELVQQGCNVVVIAPERFWKNRDYYRINPGFYSYGNERATILKPKYFVFPNKFSLGRYSLGRLNSVSYKLAVRRAFNKLNFKPDLIYSHFLYPGGPSAVSLSKKISVPSVAALGESSLSKHENIYGLSSMRLLAKKFSWFISVSEKNKNYCINKLGVQSNRIEVFPNGTNTRQFFPRNQIEMRNKYGLSKNKFLIAFIGHFIERKGPLRVLSAIKESGNDVAGIFIGSGEQSPSGEYVEFVGAVKSHNIPELLSAADIFVLPTKNEGSCNAIVEAMACGLPIISSDIAAIREQVNEENAILVNPSSVKEIAEAINFLIFNSEIRKKMSKFSLDKSHNFNLEKRTKQILELFKYIINSGI